MEQSDQVTVRDDQQFLPLAGLQVKDAIMMVNIIERLVQTGKVTGAELFPLGTLREKVVGGIAASINTVNTEEGND